MSFADCPLLNDIILKVAIQNDIMPKIIMQNVIMQNVIMQNVIMQNAILLKGNLSKIITPNVIMFIVGMLHVMALLKSYQNFKLLLL
jgi:hypothetical protein